MIRECIEQSLLSRSGPMKLWVSDVGYCPRKAMFRVLEYKKTRTLSLRGLEAMRLGVVFEDETSRALVEVLGEDRVTTQLSLRNEMWSGKADAVIDFGTDHPIIVEHKACGDKWWNYRNSIPKREHLCQVVMYGYLFQELYDITPQLLLYYRSWGHWAELGVEPLGDHVLVEGLMDGSPLSRQIDLNVPVLRAELEQWYTAQALPPQPSEFVSGCTFRGEPSCLYYDHCWPDGAG